MLESMEKQRTTSFTLTDHYMAFIERLVGSGRYSTASEVIRDGLRRFEKQLEFEERIRNLPPDDEVLIDEAKFLREIAEARKEPFVPHEEVVAELRREKRRDLLREIRDLSTAERRSLVKSLARLEELEVEILEQEDTEPSEYEKQALEEALIDERENPDDHFSWAEVQASLRGQAIR